MLAGPFGERCAIGLDRLVEPCGAALSRTKSDKCIAQIALRHGPLVRRMLVRPLLERLAEGCDGLIKSSCTALAFAEGPERIAEIVLRHGPVERHTVARPFLQCLAVDSPRLGQVLVCARLLADRVANVCIVVQ